MGDLVGMEATMAGMERDVWGCTVLDVTAITATTKNKLIFLINPLVYLF